MAWSTLSLGIFGPRAALFSPFWENMAAPPLRQQTLPPLEPQEKLLHILGGGIFLEADAQLTSEDVSNFGGGGDLLSVVQSLQSYSSCPMSYARSQFHHTVS